MIISSEPADAIGTKIAHGYERWARTAGLLAAAAGTAVAWWYARAALTLSHYDAKAHLVVARRVVDSITPGWQQIGAIWLPLPHLLNLLPVEVDAWYRTGASAVAISVLSFGLATYALLRLILTVTGSPAAAVAGATALVVNPNLLYLQATPMTEPLLIALSLLSVMLVYDWTAGGGAASPCAAGWALALACLTRYEAWPVAATALTAAVFALWRRGDTLGRAAGRVLRLARYPAAAIAAFVVQSRVTIGEWFVAGGFFVPDNAAHGRVLASGIQVWWGTHVLSGYGITSLALVTAVIVLSLAISSRRHAALGIVLAPLSSAILPWYAFFDGHPFRVRYMVPIVAACALLAGIGVGLTRWRALGAGLLVLVIGAEVRPFDPRAPMVVEAQWDRANSVGRRAITACLIQHFQPGDKIMASMGSLAHYMQETSGAGFSLRDFLHEGNGDIWLAALKSPKPYVEWIAVEEQAEGGDMLAKRAKADPSFREGFIRACEGGGVALYHRVTAHAVRPERSP